jgi:hypothetical protein
MGTFQPGSPSAVRHRRRMKCYWSLGPWLQVGSLPVILATRRTALVCRKFPFAAWFGMSAVLCFPNRSILFSASRLAGVIPDVISAAFWSLFGLSAAAQYSR